VRRATLDMMIEDETKLGMSDTTLPTELQAVRADAELEAAEAGQADRFADEHAVE
jgi:hypothetical protein